MVKELAKKLPQFKGQLHRVRCFAHILNLVVKLILHLFDADPEDDSTDTAEMDLLAMNNDIESDLDTVVSSDDAEKYEDENDVEDGSNGSGAEDSESQNDVLCCAVDKELAELKDENDIKTVREIITPVKHILVKVCNVIMGYLLSDTLQIAL
jgi:hypothetical protein